MAKGRLMNSPKDFERFGVPTGKVEEWEDGLRIKPVKNRWEWWYFDCISDEGGKLVIQFFSKSGGSMYRNGYHPMFTIKYTDKNGKEYEERATFSAKEASMSKEKCCLRFKDHFFLGDLKDYHIHVDPIKGLGADIKLHNLGKPYRPGSSYLNFGDDDRWYTWLCICPRGEVSGTITIDGKTQPIHGFGYHDHQWGNVNFLKEWNHWVWARQNFGDYSLLVFDMVSNQRSDFTRFPLVFVQDSNGNVVFENSENVECEVLGTYIDENSGKEYPKKIHYVFKNGGKTLTYDLEMRKIIECNGKKNMPLWKRSLTKLAGIDAAYTRYTAYGDMKLEYPEGEINRSGNLIYEFMYPGKTFKGHM